MFFGFLGIENKQKNKNFCKAIECNAKQKAEKYLFLAHFQEFLCKSHQ
jgi:hypothetical protein